MMQSLSETQTFVTYTLTTQIYTTQTPWVTNLTLTAQTHMT